MCCIHKEVVTFWMAQLMDMSCKQTSVQDIVDQQDEFGLGKCNY